MNYLLNPVDSRFRDHDSGIVTASIFQRPDKWFRNLDFFNDCITAVKFADYKAGARLGNGSGWPCLSSKIISNPLGACQRKQNWKFWYSLVRPLPPQQLLKLELKHTDSQRLNSKTITGNLWDKYIAMRDERNVLESHKHYGYGDNLWSLWACEWPFGRHGSIDEINACSVEIEVDVNGVKEPWLLMFKNEHTITQQQKLNHFMVPQRVMVVQSATHCQDVLCLSSNAYFRCWRYYKSTGIAETRAGKIAAARISKTAAHGYSSYGIKSVCHNHC